MRNMVDMWYNNKLDQEKKKDRCRNMLDNNTMKNECEQLKSINESKEKRSKKFSKDGKSRNKLSLAKKIGNADDYNNKVYNISKKCIIKDTNRKSNSVDIISITDNKIQGTTTITTDSN